MPPFIFQRVHHLSPASSRLPRLPSISHTHRPQLLSRGRGRPRSHGPSPGSQPKTIQVEQRMAPATPSRAATSPYASAPSSPGRRPFGGPAAEGAAGGLFLTAPPSPNPFDLLPAATPRLTGANPFDLFQHFTSAPASPRRAAAIYAQFAEGNGIVGGRDNDGEEEDDDEGFQPRGSYATAVPFDWEERPGTPKRAFGGAAENTAAWDTDFEFGTAVGKTAPVETLTTADELFDKGKIRTLKPQPRIAVEPGKIRPLKPPPGLLDGGSVGSSPRSPMSKGGMWSPRRRSKVGSGVDFDPFAAALLEATKAPSPLGGKESNVGVAPGSPPKKPTTTRPASRSAGWRRWRLSDLLLFRSSSEGHRGNKDPVFKPVQQLDPPVKKASAQAQPTTATKANGRGDGMSKPKKHGNRSAAAAAEGVAGCARLSPLQRLAKGFGGGYSWYYGRGMAAPATKG